jgi:hypothetical protein
MENKVRNTLKLFSFIKLLLMFEVLSFSERRCLKIKIARTWRPCRLVKCYRHLGPTFCLHLYDPSGPRTADYLESAEGSRKNRRIFNNTLLDAPPCSCIYVVPANSIKRAKNTDLKEYCCT